MIGETVSHYRIIEKLGEGGMGVVYRAEDTKLKRTVALKFLPPESTQNTEAIERFIREAQMASSLDHPNICTIHEIDDSPHGMFIAMACVDGQSLRERIESDSLTISEALDLSIQIASGLQEAHEHGVVHRDMKPGNVMVTPKGQAKIMDFGLAKLAGGTPITRMGTLMGTAAYMSPEQARGEGVDSRTDVWSLGVIMYEMVTGLRPFKGDYEQAEVYSILNEDPEPVRTIREGVPAGFEKVIERTLAKSPEARYQNAGEILIDLTRVKRGLEPVSTTMRPIRGSIQPSIAVLPFANISADEGQEYFCDGITEEIINALAHIDGLRVVARTSAFSFKGKSEDIREIGRKLDVGTLLEGSVQRADSRLRIMAQLVNVSDGCHLWSEKFDCEMKDVFAVQDEISLAIVHKLKVRLLGEEKAAVIKRHTEDLDAYNLYLQGRFFWRKRTEEAIRKGIDYFGEAIKKDPNYARAYTGIADSFTALQAYRMIPPEEAYPKAKEAALRALELDDELAEAHASMGAIHYMFENAPEDAEKEYRQAIHLNRSYASAHHWYSMLLENVGRFEEAVEQGERALELDPLSPTIIARMASARSRLWNWAGAEELAKRAIEIEPDNPVRHGSYAQLLAQMGRTDEAMTQIELALELAPNGLPVQWINGWLLYHTRQYDRAIDQLTGLLEVAPIAVAAHGILGMSYLEKGMNDQALAALEKSKELDRGRDTVETEAVLGVGYARAGKAAEAKSVLSNLEDESKESHVPPTFLAWLCFALGENDRGFEWLNRACEDSDYNLCELNTHPWFDAVRDDPRFATVLRKVGLKP